MTVAEQHHLPLSRHANPVIVAVDMVSRQNSLLAAIQLCVREEMLRDLLMRGAR